MCKRNKMVFFSIPAWYLSWVVFKLRPEDKISKLTENNVAHVLTLLLEGVLFACLPGQRQASLFGTWTQRPEDQLHIWWKDIRCKDRIEKYHEIHGIYRCVYSLNLLRVLDKMFIVLLKEMYLKSKKLTLTKKLHGFKGNKDALGCK